MNARQEPVIENAGIVMKEAFEQQRQAFLAHPYPSLKERKQMLLALKKSLLKHQDRLVKSLAADFSHRSEDDTLLADFMPSIMGIKYALSNLKRWMKPEKRHVGILFQPARARIEYQPLGVVGIIVPWNYPIYLSIGPLVTAIAAGNRAMLKLSEFTPYTNRILKEVIAEAFDSTEVCVIEGEADIAAQFSALPFDHLLFTGSTAVGKHVMRAAANNLTPVTLELGGKSPVIIAEDMDIDGAVERLMYGKCLNAGQTCIAPDYVLCQEGKAQDVVKAFQNHFAAMYPSIKDNKDYTAIINERQYERLQAWIEEAKAAGCDVIAINPANETFDNSQRKMPMHLVVNPPENIAISSEEIFGPILPVFTYSSIQDAVKFVQQRPRPLALYLMSHNKKTQDYVMKHTHAGGICLNDSINHIAQDDLPFGGVGPSGMGHYHGIEGFKTFSKAKSVLIKGRFNSAKLAFPPYGRWIHKLIYKLYLR
ncbi:coniferyl aldehyde dehydrogenase [Pleionea sp. CnH1-48]|uniref:coniferyl aldehyde dehydrogenase n=1 Tax=Pleionea sp. CnH1-48 TaxID=2954494 RepID=UPI0020969D9D|nr:coniferyl aldehyde dehydrogenase [Pleionea sp. CnH1-48]MCO7227106.1 coniferyl aldehyde dehydrogenase [Pleionea sp. CnH1-48]